MPPASLIRDNASRDPEALLRDLVALVSAYTAPPDASAIAPGDIVQIHPAADDVFGGLLMRVTRTRGADVEGYLLVPHRSGCKEAWYSFSAPELTPIGSLIHAEAAWGFGRNGKFRGDRYEPGRESSRLPIGHAKRA